MGNIKLQKVTVYTDGSCHGNPGQGGYAAVIVHGDGNETIVTGMDASTTNQRMEITAAIEGIKSLSGTHEVVIRSDSDYLVKGINGWLSSWKKNKWRKADKKPILNRDLWVEVDRLMSLHQVTAEWVKGHSGDEFNERCDRLANLAADGISFEAECTA